MVTDVWNSEDKDIGDAYQVVFLPDYSVSLAEILVPASDVSCYRLFGRRR